MSAEALSSFLNLACCGGFGSLSFSPSLSFWSVSASAEAEALHAEAYAEGAEEAAAEVVRPV
jgi:hypothetical protein